MAKEEEPIETTIPDVEVDPAINSPPPSTSKPHKIPRSLTLSPPKSLLAAGKTLTLPFRRRGPTFPKFMLLPVEVRILIWESAMVPRVHELHPCAKLYNDRMTFRSNSGKTPAIFHACAESRAVAEKHYELMKYEPPRSGTSGKAILRFWFCPALDTLLLNSLMGLFVMFMLLEDEEEYVGVGVMTGWQFVAFDAERAQLISLLSGLAGHSPQPRFKEVFPSLKELIVAFDYTRSGRTRFRTSVWPGENGTSLSPVSIPRDNDGGRVFDLIFKPLEEYLQNDYAPNIPLIQVAKVKRKTFIRGDVRYAFRKTCSFFGLRPRGVFRRL